MQQCFIRRQGNAIYRRVEQVGAAPYREVDVLWLWLHADVFQSVRGTSVDVVYCNIQDSTFI